MITESKYLPIVERCKKECCEIDKDILTKYKWPLLEARLAKDEKEREEKGLRPFSYKSGTTLSLKKIQE